MVTADLQNKQLTIIDERILTLPWNNEPESGRAIFPIKHATKRYVMDFNKESYILVFEGRRGGGKTTAMTYFTMRRITESGCKVYSNYPIEFMLRTFDKKGVSHIQHVKSEPLDFERLLNFDDEYRNCFILIDEAPDVISHLSAMSWQNRLINAFIRQIRKNDISLLLAAQDIHLIDKSVRWQVDVLIKCHDVGRACGADSEIEQGEIIQLGFYDESGVWTHRSTEQRLAKGENPKVCSYQIYPRFMFGQGNRVAVFDSWHQIDILESLHKVEMNLDTVKVGNKQDYSYLIEKALPLFETIFRDGKKAESIEIFGSLGLIGNSKEKAFINSCMAQSGIKTSANGNVKYFDNYDSDKFRSFAE